MPHIVHLITGLEVSGTEMTLARLVDRLDPVRFQSTVVSLGPEGSLAARIRAAGVPVHSLGMVRNSVFALGGAVKLWRLLRVLKPDILQTWLYHADFLGLVVGRLVGVRPILWNLRCADMDMSRYAASTRWLDSCAHIAERGAPQCAWRSDGERSRLCRDRCRRCAVASW